MSSMDYEIVSSYSRPYYGHQRHHTVTASSVPAYINRSVPTYSLTGQEQLPHSDSLASPRYSPNVQPWKRQQAQSSLSFIPSTSPRSEQPEYTMAQPRRPIDRSTACISPFRSVRRMKQPFQLRLPGSPSVGDTSPARESRVIQRPPEIRTLRAWRSDQNLMASSLETFGLLPSPPLSDSQPSQASPAPTYFSSIPGSEFEADRETDCACLALATSCNRCTPQTPATEVSVQNHEAEATNVHMAHSTFVRQCELQRGQYTPAATKAGCMSPPATCSDVGSGKWNFSGSSAATQRSRSGTVSSEGSWVPSSLSYCETWLQGAPMEPAEDEAGKSTVSNRRKFQIVQQSPFIPDWKRAHNDAVLAVKSKMMKPKLVDISRQSSPAMSYSLPTPTHTLPATPDHSLPEVSAFSPDTPLEMSDGGYTTHNTASYSKHQSGEEQDNTDLNPMTSETASKILMRDTGTKNADGVETEPRPPPPPKVAPSSEIQASPRAPSTKPDKQELEKLWDHEWTIDQLEHSVKDFPQNMLRLTSPVVVFLRHNQERALIRPFRQIFPNAPQSLLDSLCAVLIAKNYLLSLPSLNRKTTNTHTRAQMSRLDTVPEKANSVLGMKFAQPQPARIRDQVQDTRISKLYEDLDSIVDNLLFTLRGPHDEALKSAVLVIIQVLETKA